MDSRFRGNDDGQTEWIPAPAFAGVTFFRGNDESVARCRANDDLLT
jgi:hypothetical protein